MQHTITTSADGSSTLQLTQFGETYHSTNGAYTEAMHIYIRCGVEHLYRQTAAPKINIFDVGFGTGLNCILAWAWQQQLLPNGLPYPQIHYYGIEKYPIPFTETQQLNYPNIIAEHLNSTPGNKNPLPDKLAEIFHLIHNCPWEENIAIPAIHTPTKTNTPSGHETDTFHAQSNTIGNSGNVFILHKSHADIAKVGAEYYKIACCGGTKEEAGATTSPAVIFYDTFSPATQPELWNEEIFRTIAAGCPSGSLLVTYCSKGTVKQALRSTNFTLERLAGPPGKRHILRGTLR